jgi:hypothetical protein
LSSDREESRFREFLSNLFSRASSESIVPDLLEVAVPEPYRVRVKVVFGEQDPGLVLSRLAERSGLLAQKGEQGIAFELEERVGRKRKRQVSCVFGVVGFEPAVASSCVRAIVSVAKYEEWRVLQRFFANRFPKIAPVLLSQHELLASARKLAHAANQEVRVRALSAREKVSNASRLGARSVREWTNEDLEAVIEETRERNQTITSLDLEFLPRSGPSVHVLPTTVCKLRKTGEFEAKGNLSIAFRSVAPEFAAVGQKKFEFLEGRGLRQSLYVPRPVSIAFPRAVFDEVEQVREFVTVLRKYPNSMYSVQHGNPYAQLTLTDYGDGSSFEIWAVPPDRIVLIPGLRASPAAFERIVHFVFDRFREGRLENYGSSAA